MISIAARERRIGLACAFSVLFIWAGFILVSRFSAKGVLTPWDMAALRYAGAFLAGLPIALRHGWPRLTRRQAGGIGRRAVAAPDDVQVGPHQDEVAPINVARFVAVEIGNRKGSAIARKGIR